MRIRGDEYIVKEGWGTINALDSQIFDAIDDEGELTAEIEQADVYKEAVYAALIKAGDLLKSPSATAVAPTSAARSVTVKLPKLQLRHFSGDLTKWTSFWQLFQVSVDRNPDLSDVDKFNYLSSLLEGVAREAIAGLSLTEENYVAAVHSEDFVLSWSAFSVSRNGSLCEGFFSSLNGRRRRWLWVRVGQRTFPNIYLLLQVT